MPLDSLIPLAVFAGVLVCTPGPANMLLMASGARRGLRASLPFLAGVTLGKLFIHLGLALGLWRAVEQFPQILLIMKTAGAVYVLYLAWKILNLKIQKSESAAGGFVAGLIVHPLNPKAWAMIVSAYGQFIDGQLINQSGWWTQTAIVAAVFFCWQCAAHSFWCWSGERAAKLFYGAAGTRREKLLLAFLAAAMGGAVLWSLAN
ncbi:MAG: LysE family translocator [Gammaproteobacteria bacterium]